MREIWGEKVTWTSAEALQRLREVEADYKQNKEHWDSLVAKV